MRIGLACPYAMDVPGGVQNHVLGLAGWLRTEGHQPSIIAPGALPTSAYAAYGLDDGCFTTIGQPFPLRFNGSVAPIRFGLHSYERVGAWLDRTAPDVLHVHEPLAPSASLLSLLQSPSPVVATFHTATDRTLAIQAAGALLDDTLARISIPIAVSEAAAEVVRTYLRADPLIIGNGFRMSDFTSQAREPGPWRGGERPRVLFLGRISEPRKGLSILLAAVPALLAVRGDLDIVVAGGGELPAAAPAGVRFVGRVSDTERNHLLATSDVYVAPQTGQESFGIVLLEAMAAGASVVASDLPAFAAVLNDGRGPVGRTFATGDAQDLAATILDTLDNPVPPARARARAAEFDWDRIGPQIVDVYAAVADGELIEPTRRTRLRDQLSRLGLPR